MENKVFCNFCKCNPFKSKIKNHLYTAETIDKKNICDSCYYFYCCVNETGNENPCIDLDCEHRPVLNNKWLTFKEWKKE